MKCLLCESLKLKAIDVLQGSKQLIYFQCDECDLTFLSPHQRLSADAEKKRYDLHENIVDDQGYQDFVTPLKTEITTRLKPTDHGLDYGSGKSSAISYLLKKQGYAIDSFDPFFKNEAGLLIPENYDYIVVCEVAEHFHQPRLEFKKLKSYLKPQGYLFLLTSLRTAQIDFASWSYRRDPTHVCFFSEKTFQWMEIQLGFQIVKIKQPNLIVLQKKD